MTRDLIFNMVATGAIIAFALVGFVNYVMSAIFISFYMV